MSKTLESLSPYFAKYKLIWIGELQIDVFDGNNYIPIFNKVGEKGDFWEEENILIDPTLSSTKFRITGILSVDSDGNTWPGDIAIDEFRVFEAIASSYFHDFVN